MPTLKYRDPVDGTFKPVPGGSGGEGGGANEVTVSDTQPTDGSELWLDLADPGGGGETTSPPQSWMPVLKAGTTVCNLGTDGDSGGVYVVEGSVCTWQAWFTVGAGPDPGTGQFAFDLPLPHQTGAPATWRIVGSGWLYGSPNTSSWDSFSVDGNNTAAVRLISASGVLAAAGAGIGKPMGVAGHVMAAAGSYIVDPQ